MTSSELVKVNVVAKSAAVADAFAEVTQALNTAMRRVVQRREDRQRRARMTAFEASDPDRRLDDLGQRIRSEARRQGITLTQAWQHRVKGIVVGREVRGDETWMVVQLVGDHRLRWLSPGRARRGEVSADGLVMTFRRSAMVPVPLPHEIQDTECPAWLHAEQTPST